MSCVTRFVVLRGTTTERLAFTPMKGELVFDCDLNEMFIGDGVTPGGLEIAKDNLTSISLSGSILTFTDENGNQNDVDLTVFLDDTNAARLVNGTLNGATGIATFTRDDNSTFDVDFSALIDLQAIQDLRDDLDQETLDRAAGDTVLQTQITTNTTDIATETSDRTTADITLQTNIDTHVNDLNNPHQVTAAQTGASSVGHTHTISEITDASTVASTNDYNDLDNLPTIPSSAPVDSVNGQTGVVVITATDVGLGNVDNTSDLDKPISTATQTALDNKSDVGHTHTEVDITDLDKYTQSQVDANISAAVNTLQAQISSNDNDITSLNTDMLASLNSLTLSGTTLTATDHANNSFPLDLSPLLDDTNLSRIVSASIDAAGILTLTRNDATGLQVDLSQLDQSGDITSTLQYIDNNDIVSGTFSLNGGNITLNKGDSSTVIIDTVPITANIQALISADADLQAKTGGAGSNNADQGFFPGGLLPSGVGTKTILLTVEQELLDIASDLSDHETDVTNPHEVTITQSISQDPSTDITTGELETLTDNSIADNLHKHAELWTPNGATRIVRTNNADDAIFGTSNEIIINPGLNPRITIDDQDTDNNAELVLDDTAFRIDVDNDNAITGSSFRVRVDTDTKLEVNESNVRLYDYDSTRDDGKVPHTARTLYVDANGVVQVGEPRSSFITESGRIYCFADGRWITINDDTYGSTYYQHAENALTGTDPDQEWEHLGTVMPADVFIKNFYMMGSTNSTQVTNLEVMITYTKPAGTNTYASGIDADAEDQHETIFRGLWTDMVADANGAPFGGDMTDRHIGVARLNFLTPELGEFRLYARPIGNATGTRYFLSSRTWEII